MAPVLIDADAECAIDNFGWFVCAKYYLDRCAKHNLTATVADFNMYLPDYFPLVHPSPLNIGWRKRNPWFESDVIPALQTIVKEVLS